MEERVHPAKKKFADILAITTHISETSQVHERLSSKENLCNN